MIRIDYMFYNDCYLDKNDKYNVNPDTLHLGREKSNYISV